MDPQTRQDVKYKTKNLISTVNEKIDIGSAKFKGDDTSKLDVAVLKATSSEDVVPKEKHVVTLKSACGTGSGSGQRQHYVIQSLAQRLESHKGKWLVTLKTLIVFHRLQRETDPSFLAELLRYAERTSTRRMLRLDTFADHTTKETWDYSAWVRVYSVYLDERLDVFRVMQFDPVQDESAPTKLKTCSAAELLERMPLAHKLLNRLIACVPEGAAGNNPVVVQACGLVLKEVRAVYRLVCEAVMNLCDKFFEVDRTAAFQGLELYKENVALNDRLNAFFVAINNVGTMKGSVQFPTLQSLPADFLTTMEEYARDAPRVLDPSDPTAAGRTTLSKAPADMKSSSLVRQGGTTSGALAGEPGVPVVTLPPGTLKVGGPIAAEPGQAPAATAVSTPALTGPAPSLDLLGDSFLQPSPGSGPAATSAPAPGAAAPLQTVDSFFGGAWMASNASHQSAGSTGAPQPMQQQQQSQPPQQQQQGFGAPAGYSPGATTEMPPAPAFGGYGAAAGYPGAQQHTQQGFPGPHPPGGYPGAPYGGASYPYAPSPYGAGPNPYSAPGAHPYTASPPGPFGAPASGPYGAPLVGSNPFTSGAPAGGAGGFNPFASPSGLGNATAAVGPATGSAPAWNPNHDPLSNLSIDILGKPSGYVPPPPTLKQLGQAKPQ